MLPDVTFNVARLPITCTTLKNNEANIPHKTAINPWYRYIILQKLTPICHHFCSYIQRSHVSYVQADFGNVTRNIPCCLMFTRFLATLFSTYHVALYCACFFQLSSIFGCLVKNSYLSSTFASLVRIFMLSAKYGCLTEYAHLSSIFGRLTGNPLLSSVFSHLLAKYHLNSNIANLVPFFL